jgi:nicotinic acid mononucleotide adenylyltransferase
MIRDRIKRLHAGETDGTVKGPYRGVLVETGCGVEVARALFEVPGASSTIHSTLSPYSREAQAELFGEATSRAVSSEWVAHGLQVLVGRYGHEANFVYYSSFQLTGPDEDRKSTHGWVGVAKKTGDGVWQAEMVHISHHLHGMNRTALISAIGDECTLYLLKFLFGEGLPALANIDILRRGRIDAAGASWSNSDADVREVIAAMNEKTFVSLAPSNTPKGKTMLRVEDVFRDHPSVNLYKGSFRPITKAHVAVVSDFHQQPVIFMISADTFDKGEQDIDSILWRARLINELGYTVVVTRNGYFAANAAFFRRKFGAPINFLVGSDTLNRIVSYAKDKDQSWTLDGDPAFQDCTFWTEIRPHSPLCEGAAGDRVSVMGSSEDISATMVRQMRLEGNTEGVRGIVPAKVFDLYMQTPIEN